MLSAILSSILIAALASRWLGQTVGIIAIVVAVRRKLWRHPLSPFLLAWALPGLVILHLASGKNQHYAYPLLPPASIVMACGLVYWLRLNRPRPLVPRWLLASLLMIGSAVGIAVLWRVAPDLPMGVTAMAITVCAGVLVTLWLDAKQRTRATLVALFATVAAALLAANLVIRSPQDRYILRRQFAAELPRLVGSADQRIYLVGLRMDAITWYSPNPITRADDLQKFMSDLAASEGPTYALLPASALPTLQSRFRVERLAGPNDHISSGKRKEPLTLVRIASPSN